MSSHRPISEEEINHLKERHYTALSDKQRLIDQQLQVEVRTILFNTVWLSYLAFMFQACVFLLIYFSLICHIVFFCFVICVLCLCVCFIWLLLLQLEAQEEKLRLEEEARNAAQREAARLARERKLKEVRRQLSAPFCQFDLAPG